MNPRNSSEADTRSKLIDPNLHRAGWSEDQIEREHTYTDGKIQVYKGKSRRAKRGKTRPKSVDYLLYLQPGIPIAVIEAKKYHKSLDSGLQQALEYAKDLAIPFVFSSNGSGFIFHNKYHRSDEPLERELALNEFPGPDELWKRFAEYHNFDTHQREVYLQEYFVSTEKRPKKPRYYQLVAINKTVEAVLKGQDRILLVMATGTGKTFTAFNIIYRLWRAGVKKRILFLADRINLIAQAKKKDFRHFKEALTIIKKKEISIRHKDGTVETQLVSNSRRGISSEDKAYEIYLGLYQGLTSSDGPDAYRDFSPDFFDLIVVDECHRGSAREDSEWRAILDYFSTATHLGLTATPKETKQVSNSEYFGVPIYTYSLRQGIDDGFLAPYEVLRVNMNVDVSGFRPSQNQLDKNDRLIEDREYGINDFDRDLVIEERTKQVAKRITDFLRNSGDRMAKAIVFCVDIDHAERMRRELINLNHDLYDEDDRYVMCIVGNNPEGKKQLENFIDEEEAYPVIATTSKLLTTGVDAVTCKVIAIDSNIASMTEFKQIIGRGTRLSEEYGKTYFTILDFRNVTRMFADDAFDGAPIRIKEVDEEDPIGDDLPTDEDADLPGDDPTPEPEEANEPPRPTLPAPPPAGPRPKFVVNGIDVKVLMERTITFDHRGKPVTKKLTTHTGEQVREQYQTLEEFLQHWNRPSRKTEIIEQLRERGVLIDELRDAVGAEVDDFDLLCHVAYDQPPLTRHERANRVKKRNYFGKYGETARAVLEALLDKYATEGIEDLENIRVLKIDPFTQIGSPLEIVQLFGGRTDYEQAVRELETEIYRASA